MNMEKFKKMLVSAGNAFGQVASICCKTMVISIGFGFSCMLGADLIDKKQRKQKKFINK